MNTCQVCSQEFKPKRKEQKLCSVVCRQSNNARGRLGQKTGPQSKQYTTRFDKDGYLRMYAGKHPYANGRKEIQVHVMLMEVHIGRAITDLECVHHINEIKTDNRLENLELMSHAEHSRMHALESQEYRTRNSRGQYA